MENNKPSAGSENTDSGNQIQAPSISLPKGGGAIKGIDEKFTVNGATGTGSQSIPIFTSPGRNNFQPQLSLAYNSGTGNSPFGMGWDLSVPNITRKTDKGVPRYFDNQDSDTFIMSGAEDLVPYLVKKGDIWERKEVADRELDGQSYSILFYRPRIEGLFARIEKWTNNDDSRDIFWRATTPDNVSSIYGKSDKARIVDPSSGGERIFKWLLEQTYDDKGNIVVYSYKEEDRVNIEEVSTVERESLNAGVYENNRVESSSAFSQRYLKKVLYGNKTPYQVGGSVPSIKDGFLFEVVFDYGDHDRTEVAGDGTTEKHIQYSHSANSNWLCRQDPFSSYRSGFEIRTYRLCRRILMYHHFAELGDTPCLVKSTDLTYNENMVATKLISATQTGYKRVAGSNNYRFRSFPPVEFSYTPAKIDSTVHDVSPDSLENLPIGLDNAQYKWVDLDGEGISGILTEQAGAWHYKPNLGDGEFGAMKPVSQMPSMANLGGGEQRLLDLAGDGQLDLVLLDAPITGFYERTTDFAWHAFKPFQSEPNINWQDPNLRFVDLNGDGHADILITEDQLFVWYPSLKEDGYGPANSVHKKLDEEKGPAIVFADASESIYLADMSGDGLTDLVRIRNGEVCYWPNLGYGRFGAKVTMASPPFFDMPDQFDPKRIRLGDIDGTGTSDIFYLGRGVIRFWYNRSGNSWSNPEDLSTFPKVDNLATINVVDLLGNGTSCLVWSSPLPGDARRPMRYIDLMGGRKPHLLVNIKNNMGAETKLTYASSTKFYLADKKAGTPWITRLAFPVHVVERVETYDHISRNRFVTRYAYHHGYYDGVEREFRGFGRVDQWDTEEFAALEAGGLLDDADNLDNSSHMPPVHTKTWFHTGAFLDGSRISKLFEREYYREPGLTDIQARELLLEDTILPPDLIIEEEREACRALKGSMLRQEVYACDNTDKAEHPYTVAEQNFTIRRLQPKGGSHHAVFFTHAREAVTYNYERNPDDPRIQHALTLEVDDFGNVLKKVAIGYGRRPSNSPLDGADRDKQEQVLVTYTENRVTNTVDDVVTYPKDFRTPLPCETRTCELTGYSSTGPASRFVATDFVQQDPIDPDSLQLIFDEEINYEDDPTHGRQRRLIEHVRTLYRADDMAGFLALGELEPLALPGESYKLAYTPGILTDVYGGRITDAMLADEGGYVHSGGDDNWWIPSGRIFYKVDADIDNPAITATNERAEARNHFFLPRKYTNQFKQSSTVDYEHDLLVATTADALTNTVQAEYDFRVLQPSRMIDPNNNNTIVDFDVLGLVAGTAIQGKIIAGQPESGDNLDNFGADLTQAERDAFFEAADPHDFASGLLNEATTRIIYDLDCFRRSREANPEDPDTWQPVYAATLARETHVSSPPEEGGEKIQISFSYSDGFGREVQKKIQAEPGSVPQRDGNGNIIIGDNNLPVMTGGSIEPRWVGSGWTVFNNKGKPVRQFEPFFTDLHSFEFNVRIGVSPYLFYDPIGRGVATLHPNHTWEKVVFDPWYQETWDVNDTVLITDPKVDPDVLDFFSRLDDFEYLPTWHAQRIGGGLGPQEQTAADRSARHADTPTIAHFDSLGRPFLTLAHNRFDQGGVVVDEYYATRIELDIEGNQRQVIDARGHVVMRYSYYMAGPEKDENGQDTGANRIYQDSMDGGDRWILNDVAGQSIRSWDSRGHAFETLYDELRRPKEMYVSGEDTDLPDARSRDQRILFEKIEYGEGQTDDTTFNLRTRAYKQKDGAGVVSNEEYDFKGNMLRTSRQLAKDYKQIPNWSGAVQLEAEVFNSSTRHDALNRPIELVAPYSSSGGKRNTIRPNYNDANLLDSVNVNLREQVDVAGDLAWTQFVNNIDYDAKGQRTLIEYGNDVSTRYKYDPLTFRLFRLYSYRPEASFPGDDPNAPDPPRGVQNLSYFYDPAGNITSIRDQAQPRIFFDNACIEASNDYLYDAIYRLIGASGREHQGNNAPPGWKDSSRKGNPITYNCQGIRRYVERYRYDAVGNIMEMVNHEGNNSESPGQVTWRRRYQYSTTNNQLRSTSTPGEAPKPEYSDNSADFYTDTYVHDVHGNIIKMPHLGGGASDPNMHWDFKDQLRLINRGGGGEAFYVYDSAGQRVRKVWEKSPGLTEECIYLGGFEIFRRHEGAIGTDTATLERESLHIMDDKQRIALVESRTKGDDGSPLQLIRYQLNNHLGSACAELNSQALIISYEEYYPYGSTSYQAKNAIITSLAKRYRYTGKERDEESGFSYHGARYYAPWLGRWGCADPAGMVDGLNLYKYARNNPTRYADPTGLATLGFGEIVEAVPGGTVRTQIGIKTSEGEGHGLPVTKIVFDFTDSPASEVDTNITPIVSADSQAECVKEDTFPEPDLLDELGDAFMESETGQFIVGALMGGMAGAAPFGFTIGIGGEASGLSEDLPRSFRMGYGAGEAAWGIAQIIGGIGGEVGGGALVVAGAGATATGAGAPLGVAGIAGGVGTISVSTAVIVEGAADVGTGFGVFMSALESNGGGGARGISRVWPKHHAFPKYLGGAAEQTLKKIPRKLHYRFHAALDKWKGGIYARSKGAAHFEGMNKQNIIKDLREFYETAEGGIFKKYLPDFNQAVRQSQ